MYKQIELFNKVNVVIATFPVKFQPAYYLKKETADHGIQVQARVSRLVVAVFYRFDDKSI